jgi:hypothetical protein
MFFYTTIQVHSGGIRTNAFQFLGGKEFFPDLDRVTG